MLFGVRTHTCRPGCIGKHIALYAEKGMAAQCSISRPPAASRR